jgi:Leucine-rich repeat (LRR) protein
MTKDEVDAVTAVDVRSKNIEDLTGIERFPALKELYCLANKLTALDISKNTGMVSLDCRNNKITFVTLSPNQGKFVKLWYAGNPITNAADLEKLKATSVVANTI